MAKTTVKTSGTKVIIKGDDKVSMFEPQPNARITIASQGDKNGY